MCAYAYPEIVPFNYVHDFEPVTKLCQQEWHNLFTIPFDSGMLHRMFALRKSGDPTQSDKQLLINVLKADKQVIGFVTYFMKNPKTVHLELLAIDKEQRGNGYGTQLLNHVAQFGTKIGAQNLQLFVLNHNKRGFDFYHRLGFVSSLKYPGYVLLCKNLTAH
jgi:ribosomal protein S18 acetylase RimI-like enzyme